MSHKIRDRIRRLREMTSARGCTEAEALTAAAKAAERMRDHGLSEADIVLEEAASASGSGRSPRAGLWPVIAFCTNTAHLIVTTPGVGSEVRFIGRDPGPEIALYLRAVCEGAIDRAVRQFKLDAFYRRRRGLSSKRAAVAAFTDGMVNRLRWRLREVFAPALNADALQEAEQALAERFSAAVAVKLPDAPLRHNEARFQGWKQGDKVTLAHGVNGTADRVRIGRSA